MAETVQVTIDGQTVQAPNGANLIEAAKRVGIEIPHFCYHPKLSVAGNCRMCLVEVGLPKLGPDNEPMLDADGRPVILFWPKLAIGCKTTVADGMVVLTRSPKVIKARQGVMEFLLINHPLDCPICDQAGECLLQEYAVDYGQGRSRFAERKVRKPKRVRLNDKITLDNERCILCSRCIRFMREIAGQDCLGFTQRGSFTTLTAYPGEPPDTNYDLNLVDLCPVGALTSTDFRFRQRVWFLKETKSICPHCATGCNITIWSREGTVYRLTPRPNDAVNQCWMCDYGRLHYRFINDPNRLSAPMCRGRTPAWEEALRQVEAALGTAEKLAVLASGRATTEELFLLKQLGAARYEYVPRTGPADGFLLNRDRNPNAGGAKLLGFGDQPERIAEGIRNGSVRSLVLFGEDLFEPELLAKLDLLVVMDTRSGRAAESAHFVLPITTFAETAGTFLNAKGRLQRLNPAIPPVGGARPGWWILAQLLRRSYDRFDDLFAEMAQTIPPLSGLSFSAIGDEGVEVKW